MKYYVLFTNHTQYRSRKHNNTLQKLIFNYTCLHEHTHLKLIIIYIEDMHTKKVNKCAVTSERSVFS